MDRKPNRYLVAKWNGDVEAFECQGEIPLDKLQELVGGYIEHVRIDHALSCMVNEEGRLMGLPTNPFCRNLCGNLVFGCMQLHPDREDDVIFGPPPQKHHVIQTLEELLSIRDALRLHAQEQRSKQTRN